MIISLIILAVSGYLLGSIPSSVWTGKWFFGKDVRQFGSGNAGATNTFRVLGKTAGTIVLLIDVAKGYIATLLPVWFLTVETEWLIPCMLLTGVMAVIGHLFPVFAGFKGGKGVATLLGLILAVHPEAALISCGFFLLVLIVSGYVSLASILSALIFPVVLILVFSWDEPVFLTFTLIMAALLIVSHRTNIMRLMNRTESRVQFFKQNK